MEAWQVLAFGGHWTQHPPRTPPSQTQQSHTHTSTQTHADSHVWADRHARYKHTCTIFCIDTQINTGSLTYTHSRHMLLTHTPSHARTSIRPNTHSVPTLRLAMCYCDDAECGGRWRIRQRKTGDAKMNIYNDCCCCRKIRILKKRPHIY